MTRVLTDFVDSVLHCPLSQDKYLQNVSGNIFVSTFRRTAEERERLFHSSGVREYLLLKDPSAYAVTVPLREEGE